MSFKTFLIGMFASFSLAWISLIAIPSASMGERAPLKMNDDDDAPYYQHHFSGRVLNGASIYQANGCYTCHSQLIRPTYAGSQIHRPGTAGVQNDEGDSSRETSYDDFAGEHYAQIGLSRMGPDLSNFGYRAEQYAADLGITAEQWVLKHLYDPRESGLRRGKSGETIEMGWSNCPSQRQMFEKTRPIGQEGSFVVKTKTKKKGHHSKGKKNKGKTCTIEVRAKQEARVLASYLLSFKRDDKLPAAINYGPLDEDE